MSRRKRNIGSSTRKNVPIKKDIYNVKENLKKLKSGTGKESYSTESTPFNDKSANEYYSTRHQDDTSMYSTTTTADRFERINDKFSSDISVLKDVITDHKEKITEKLIEKVDKTEFRYWISGAVGLIFLIGGIIYTLSYQEIITDTKDLKENQNEINRHIDKIDFKIEQIEKKVENKSNLNIQKKTN